MAATRRRSNNSTATDAAAVELEALRRDDSSWQPCRVSLSSSRVELIVDYGSTDSEDSIVSEEEAIACLRVRSIPLDGDDCVHIQEGDHVLATQKSQSKSFFFDAEVEKVLRVRHSKKVHCRCTFVIRWLNQELKGGTLTIPSSSVMKMAAKSISEHPTVSKFLSMMSKRMGCSSRSLLPTVTADLGLDINLHELLEKQIKIIHSFSDMPKKRVSDNIVLCVEVAAASKLNKSHGQAPPGHNHLKKTTRSTGHLQAEMEVKDPSPPAPSIQEELSESRAPLNPLAARAAFASFLSKMPQIASSIPFEPEKNKAGNSLISTISASGNTQFMVMGASSIRLAKEKGTGTNTSQLPDSWAGFECSVSEMKVSHTPKVTRLTRSALKKGARIPYGSCVEQKLQTSTSPRRFTRSAVCKAKECQTVEAKHLMEEHRSGKQSVGDCSGQMTAENGIKSMKATQGLEADMVAQNTKLNSLEGNVPAANCSILETRDCSSSPLDAEGDSPHIEENPNEGKISCVVKATEKSEGKFRGNGESSRSMKRKRTPSKELRRSPRLQFLPRACSQKKS